MMNIGSETSTTRRIGFFFDATEKEYTAYQSSQLSRLPFCVLFDLIEQKVDGHFLLSNRDIINLQATCKFLYNNIRFMKPTILGFKIIFHRSLDYRANLDVKSCPMEIEPKKLESLKSYAKTEVIESAEIRDLDWLESPWPQKGVPVQNKLKDLFSKFAIPFYLSFSFRSIRDGWYSGLHESGPYLREETTYPCNHYMVRVHSSENSALKKFTHFFTECNSRFRFVGNSEESIRLIGEHGEDYNKLKQKCSQGSGALCLDHAAIYRIFEMSQLDRNTHLPLMDKLILYYHSGCDPEKTQTSSFDLQSILNQWRFGVKRDGISSSLVII